MSEFKGRREDDRLLSGRGRYTADWNLPGQLYGFFLRSDHAHADIASLNLEEAKRSPDTVAVFTGEDVKDFKTAPPLVRFPGRSGAALKQPHRATLARERVRFVGQEIALVVATSAAAAQDAAEKIEVEYRDLPPLVDAEAALANGAPQLHADIPGNLSFDYEYGNEAAVNEAFARAAHVTRVVLDSTRVVGNPMEPKAALAAYDAASGSFDLYSPTQGITLILGSLAAITGVPRDKIRVHAAASASARTPTPSTAR